MHKSTPLTHVFRKQLFLCIQPFIFIYTTAEAVNSPSDCLVLKKLCNFALCDCLLVRIPLPYLIKKPDEQDYLPVGRCERRTKKNFLHSLIRFRSQTGFSEIFGVAEC